ncbi:unnamed protein product [Symbiodinium natans]|uniref:Uncharacterized protein n=1 Tax=Symbiodinium natans TaxID=878477 RepID=A0A812I273_9DINO|nr:unnamed protein product [Symbiodinium natans]
MDLHPAPAIDTRQAIVAFDAVLDQKLGALRVALMEEHRRLLHVSDVEVATLIETASSRRSSIDSQSRRSSIESQEHQNYSQAKSELASSQLETFPRAPPSLNDWQEDEPEEPPPADIPESDRPPAHLRNSVSSLSASLRVKDPTKKAKKKSVSFLPHIEVCEYYSMESQSSSELRALWKWPDENDPDEDTEDLLHELGVTGSNHAFEGRCVRCLTSCVTPPMSRRRMVWDSLALIILAIEEINGDMAFVYLSNM